jgi:hypothetical protein
VSARDFHLRIGRLVIRDEGALSAPDLAAAIGQAIRQRLEGAVPPDARRSLPERIADDVLGHPKVAAPALPDRGRPARPAHSHVPFMTMSMSGRDARGPEDNDMRPRQ